MCHYPCHVNTCMYIPTSNIASSWESGGGVGKLGDLLFSVSFLYIYNFASCVCITYSRNVSKQTMLPTAIPVLWSFEQADPSVVVLVSVVVLWGQ